MPVLLNLQTRGELAVGNLLILGRQPVTIPPIKLGHSLDPAISNRLSRRGRETCDGYVIPVKDPAAVCAALAARGVTIAFDSFTATAGLVGLVPSGSQSHAARVDMRSRRAIRVCYGAAFVGITVARIGEKDLPWWAIFAGVVGVGAVVGAGLLELRLRRNRRRDIETRRG
jgi:hypothetical protein